MIARISTLPSPKQLVRRAGAGQFRVRVHVAASQRQATAQKSCKLDIADLERHLGSKINFSPMLCSRTTRLTMKAS